MESLTASTVEGWQAYLTLYISLIVMVFVAFAYAIDWKCVRGRRVFVEEVYRPSETFLTGVKTQPWWALSFSWFAGLFGPWVLTATVETAMLTGWWGVLLYATCCVGPYLFLLWGAPAVRNAINCRGFTVMDYVQERFGLSVHILMSLICLTVMFCGQVADLSAIVYALAELSPTVDPVVALVSIGVVTTLYTIIGGFAASMMTDKVQAVLILLLMVVVYTTLFTVVGEELKPGEWRRASTWQVDGIVAGLVLNFSTFLATFMDLAVWQKVFAGRSIEDVRKGIVFAQVLVFPSMVLFGSAGILALAAKYSGFISLEPGTEASAFFKLVALCPTTIVIFTLLLTTTLICSSFDSRVNSISNFVGSALQKHDLDMNYSRIFGIILTALAIVVASFNPPSIMAILMVSNLLATVTGSIFFLGLWHKATWIGCWAGTAAGTLSVLTIGWIRLGPFAGGFQWFLFPLGFYRWDCLLTFLVVPLTYCVFCVLVSLLHIRLHPQTLLDQETRMMRMADPSVDFAGAELCVANLDKN